MKYGGGDGGSPNPAGALKRWGFNDQGRLGDGTRNKPIDVKGLASGVSLVATGETETCALIFTEIYEPTDVPGVPSGIVRLTVGQGHACALTNLGAVKCWGFNSNGQLGDGTTMASEAPVSVTGLL